MVNTRISATAAENALIFPGLPLRRRCRKAAHPDIDLIVTIEH